MDNNFDIIETRITRSVMPPHREGPLRADALVALDTIKQQLAERPGKSIILAWQERAKAAEARAVAAEQIVKDMLAALELKEAPGGKPAPIRIHDAIEIAANFLR